MTIQNNGKNKNNQTNEPLTFNEEETKFIEMSFRIVRGQLSHPVVKKEFPDGDLDFENEDHIRLVIKYYHDYFRMPAGHPHQLKDAIFRKLGYWQDGKTTLEAHKHKILQEKLDNEKRLAEITLKRKQALSKEIEIIKKELEDIEKNPIIYKYDLTKEYERIEKELKESIQVKEVEQTKQLQTILQEQQASFQKYAEIAYKKAEEQKRIIEDEVKKKALIEGKKKLQDAMERIEKASVIPNTREETSINKRNEDILIELNDIDSMTVVELRNFAKDKNIDWAYTMKKDELIEHIKSELRKGSE